MISLLLLPCYFQGVSFHLWSAYLAGLSWQTCRHWTGEMSNSSSVTQLDQNTKDFYEFVQEIIDCIFKLSPALYFTGNVCRDSDRSGPVELLWVEAEEALLQTWVEIHTSSQHIGCLRHISVIKENPKSVRCSVVCDFLRLDVWSYQFLSLSSATPSSLLGVDKVIQYAVTEWLTDIRKNQLPGILGGVGPMHSVVQLCELRLLISAPNTLLYFFFIPF